MKKEDFELFAEAMLEVAKRFGYQLSEDKIISYWHDLKGYPTQTVLFALKSAVIKLRFFPKISEIINLIEGSDEQKAERAWLELLKAVREHGAYSTVYIDAKTAWVLEHLYGGWDQFCLEVRSDNRTFLHSQFIKAYHAAPDLKGVSKLQGIIEGNNLANGYALEGAKYTPIAFVGVTPQEAIEAEKKQRQIGKSQNNSGFNTLADIVAHLDKAIKAPPECIKSQ